MEAYEWLDNYGIAFTFPPSWEQKVGGVSKYFADFII